MKLDVSTPTVENFFKDCYEIPAFQREYVWGKNEVQRLLDDLYDSLYDENGSVVETEYFIGSIVAYLDNDSFQLIDGQQRTTTLLIILCAIRDLLEKLHVKTDVVSAMIKTVSSDKNGEEIYRYRLKPLYEDASQAIAEISDAKIPSDWETNKKTTKSARNMFFAHSTVTEFLIDKFNDDSKKIKAFFATFTKKTRLVKIVTPTISEALRIFETINDRGVGLDSMDLLKNRLFIHVKNKDDYKKLTSMWKEMTGIIVDKAKEKPLRFLRYFILSQYEFARNKQNKPLTEDDLYDWLASKEVDLEINTKPLDFAKKLLDYAEKYESLIRVPTTQLKWIAKHSSRARQHFIICLSIYNYPDAIKKTILDKLESVFFAYIISQEPTKALDLCFSNLAPKLYLLGKNPNVSEVSKLLSTSLDIEITKLLPRVSNALELLSLRRKTTCRIVLSKIAAYADNGVSQNYNDIDYYWNKDIEIEHILPNKHTKTSLAYFDNDIALYEKTKNLLGNLILLEKSINSSAKQDDFLDKKDVYSNSKMFMTRQLGKNQAIGTNDLFTKMSKNFTDFPNEETKEWNQLAIKARQLNLRDLAIAAWKLDV